MVQSSLRKLNNIPNCQDPGKVYPGSRPSWPPPLRRGQTTHVGPGPSSVSCLPTARSGYALRKKCHRTRTTNQPTNKKRLLNTSSYERARSCGPHSLSIHTHSQPPPQMHSVCGSKCVHHQCFPRASLFGELYGLESSQMQQAVSFMSDANSSLSSRALKKHFYSLGRLSCRQLTSHPSPCRPLLLLGRGSHPPPFHGPRLISLCLPHSPSPASRSPKRLLLKAGTPPLPERGTR